MSSINRICGIADSLLVEISLENRESDIRIAANLPEWISIRRDFVDCIWTFLGVSLSKDHRDFKKRLVKAVSCYSSDDAILLRGIWEQELRAFSLQVNYDPGDVDDYTGLCEFLAFNPETSTLIRNAPQCAYFHQGVFCNVRVMADSKPLTLRSRDIFFGWTDAILLVVGQRSLAQFDSTMTQFEMANAWCKQADSLTIIRLAAESNMPSIST